ncbi:hypothetical protein PHPALM_31041 [Phytophthora palmivora]|uniref:Uncharacterized protein n=1 Tax=Phytophthora palmivora TaxID=4796 RepID=A0A2P4X3K4_9STRA|nr:hypothetical protein PHPALM_31041 [Phytophthora palmivora]
MALYSHLVIGKLLLRWDGPFHVVDAISHSFIVRLLLTNAIHEVNGPRLKYYNDPNLEVTEELAEHIAN